MIRITQEYFKTDSNRHKAFIYYVFLNQKPLIYIELFFKLTKMRSTLESMQMHYDAFGGNSPASGNQRKGEHRLAKRKQCQTFAIVANCQATCRCRCRSGCPLVFAGVSLGVLEFSGESKRKWFIVSYRQLTHSLGIAFCLSCQLTGGGQKS